MFWERYENLCESIGKKPNSVAAELGFASGSVTKWKNGAIPNGETLLKIARYFGCTTDFILGENPLTPIPILKPEEWEIVFSELSVPTLLELLERLTKVLREKQSQAGQESR